MREWLCTWSWKRKDLRKKEHQATLGLEVWWGSTLMVWLPYVHELCTWNIVLSWPPSVNCTRYYQFYCIHSNKPTYMAVCKLASTPEHSIVKSGLHPSDDSIRLASCWGSSSLCTSTVAWAPISLALAKRSAEVSVHRKVNSLANIHEKSRWDSTWTGVFFD